MGCLRTIVFQIGCLVLLVALAFFGWVYREQTMDLVRRLRGLPPTTDVVFVMPAASPAEGQAALDRLAQRGGPAYVDLSAAEVGALIDAAMARTGRRVVDSVGVALLEDELRLRGSLDLSGIPRNALGPFASALGQREPLVIGGPLAVDSAGRLVMRVTTLRVKDFPFPRSTIPALVRQLRLPGAEGNAIPVPGMPGVGDVRVTPAHVRFYRAAQR
jgi:hypothetical protein